MSYNIDLSFDIRKRGNVTETKRIFTKEAEKYGCEMSFFDFEFSGHNRTLKRSHYIMTFIFCEDDKQVAKFIRFCKKVNNINIESIFFSNLQWKIMYASKIYLNSMEKYAAKKYIKDRKDGLLYKKDSLIMKELYAKN